MSPVKTIVCVAIWVAIGFGVTIRHGLATDVDICTSESGVPRDIGGILRMAECLQRNGDVQSAIQFLEAAEHQENDQLPLEVRLELLARIASASIQINDYRRAFVVLNDGILAAQSAARPELAVSLLNDLGRLFVANDAPLFAIASFDDAWRLAGGARAQLRAGVALNLTRSRIENGVDGGIKGLLDQAEANISTLADPVNRGRHYLTQGTLYREAQVKLGLPAAWRVDAYDAYEEALRLSAGRDDRLYSRALGYIGALYEDEGRLSLALNHTRRAALVAQRSGSDEDLYKWYWQSGRILRAQGAADEALRAYRLATATVDDIRLSIVQRSDRSFRRDIQPLYFELADLLLERTATLASTDAVNSNLMQVRDTLEQLKVAEVEDYFADECAVNDDLSQLEQLAADTAVLYPVLLEHRVELLLSLSGRLTQHTTRIDRQMLDNAVTQLRLALENPESGDTFRPYAEKLYEWLIAPIESEISAANVKTLVLVPDGALRTIPLSVLHDGNRFLIERYAVVTSPGLTLTAIAGETSDPGPILVNGLTQSIAGFPALPHVAEEMDSIASFYPTKVNRDAAFSASGLESELAEEPYDFVHIATHGQFHSDHRRSFLLAHDDVITMNRLEEILGLRQYVSKPVDLLFLSACQTAAGDERAALGLAGVAVKSGAASVVASLWLINDQSTANLVSGFYEQLRDGSNKAQALQKAQLSLMRGGQYSHPYYWAPFLLLGNWR